MARLEITDADRAAHRQQRTLAELLKVEPPAPAPYRLGRYDWAAIVCGLFVAFAGAIFIQRIAPPAVQPAPDVIQHTSQEAPGRTIAKKTTPTMAQPTATTAPTASPQPTDPPPPTPEPVVIVQTCYSSVMQVFDSRGYPLGEVSGQSCDSQAAADAEAAALAEQMRAGR